MPDIPTHEFALYHINEIGALINSACPHPFLATRYSKYKYGASSVSDAFADDLGHAFQRAYPQLINAPYLLLASSPYKFVPTAAHALTRTFLQQLNRLRYSQSLPLVRLVKIERQQPFAGDYGQLSIERRLALMHTNPLTLDRTQFHNADLIMIDDIKVSGAHQHCLIRTTDELTLSSRTFLHVLILLNQSSEALDPTIEDRLNHAFVKKLNDLMEIVQAPDFVWNARVCKFLLNASSRAELPAFLGQMPDHFLFALYRNSIGDGYDLVDAYRESHRIVQTALQQRRLLTEKCRVV